MLRTSNIQEIKIGNNWKHTVSFPLKIWLLLSIQTSKIWKDDEEKWIDSLILQIIMDVLIIQQLILIH